MREDELGYMVNIDSVALFIYNRPEATQRIFSCIRKAKPKKLFLVADGSNSTRQEDERKCAEARKVTEAVDWDCQVFRNFSVENMGCKRRISSGISWVFNYVDQVIILEDDCLPDSSFFRFSQELLDRYHQDARIMAISGNNFQFGRSKYKEDSYYFSRYPHCWGWATWKRAWSYYDVDMCLWPQAKEEGWLQSILSDSAAVRYWEHKFQQTYAGNIDTWDYAWTMACWFQNGLCILPKDNLVSNIGFGTDGTHHTHGRSPFSCMPTKPVTFPLNHPSVVIRNTLADQFTQSYQFGLVARSRRKLRSIFRV